MPRFEPDPSKISATIAILEKDEYEFLVGEPKSFEKKNADGTIANYGIRYPLTVMEGPRKGAKQFQTCYQHTEGSEAFSKRFVMACLGYDGTPDGEKAFDSAYAGRDWSFNTDDGSCGEVWRECANKRVFGAADVGVNNKTKEPMQQFTGWRALQ